MVILVGVVMLIYIVLLVIARRADSHDVRKGGLVCLSDNNISDSQLYEVVLDTGLRQSTPTTAKVGLEGWGCSEGVGGWVGGSRGVGRCAAPQL